MVRSDPQHTECSNLTEARWVYIHHVSKCVSCHKAIAVIIRRAYCFHNWIYIYIYVYIYIYIYSIWYKLTHFSLLLIPAIQIMGNTPNILYPKRMKQVESHLHLIFYCKLSKVSLDYISELINLKYSFNLPFKFSLKNIKMGSFSILWWCTFKNCTHTFTSDTHASLQSLSWRWIW